MRDLHDQLRAYGLLVDEAVAPVRIEEAIRQTTVSKVPTSRRLHPVLVAAAAALIVLIVIGGLTLLLNTGNRPVIGPVTTTVPAPNTTPAPTTSAAPAIAEAAAPLPAITWARIEDPVFDGPTDQSRLSVRHIGSAFYVVGNDLENKSGVIWRSEDGYTWERFDDLDVFGGPPGLHGISDIAGNGGIIVALGWEGNEAWVEFGERVYPEYSYENPEAWCRDVVWVSEDEGHTWTRLSHEEAFGTGNSCETGSIISTTGSVISTSNGFLAAYHDIWASQDGLHWTKVGSVGRDDVVEDLAITPSGIVGVGQAWEPVQQSAAWWSANSTEWTRVSDEDGQFRASHHLLSWLGSVVATDNGLVAVGTAGANYASYMSLDAAVWLSSNGHTWRRMHDPELKGDHQEVMRDVIAVGDLLIAVGETSGGLGYWPQPLPGTYSNGVVWISEDDGATWHRMDDHDRVFGSYLADWITLRGIASSGSQLVAAGYDSEGLAVWTGTIEKGD